MDRLPFKNTATEVEMGLERLHNLLLRYEVGNTPFFTLQGYLIIFLIAAKSKLDTTISSF